MSHNIRNEFSIILEAVQKIKDEPTQTESEEDTTKYRKAAKKMIQMIKDKSPDWKDEDGSVEKAFYDNMIKMKNGEL
jgi:predicted Ser/Thr protein kinase